jgi:glycosyltransferase involved in cell wall biosynthesis
MTVLWVDLVSEMGGAQHSLLEVCAALSSAGAEVVAAVPQGPLFDRLAAAGVKVFPVSPVRASRRGWGLFSTTAKLLRAPGTVAQIIKAVKPDIIHANSLTAFLAASRTGTTIPVIWHVRDLRLPALVAHEASKKAALIIAASDAIDEHLVEILSPRLLGRIRVVRNGIDPARFATADKAAARSRLGLPPNAPVIGMIAHLIPWKRHDAFIEAAAAIRLQRPDAHFVIVGRDLFRENARWVLQLESQIRQAGLDDRFHWIKDAETSHDILPAFDLLLHPALGEPFGRIICEAMAAKVPVIAADSAGPASIIEHKVSGLLVRDGDARLMADEALGLLSDPERAARLAEAGSVRVLSRFTTGHVCEQLVKGYNTLLAAVYDPRAPDDE